MGSKLNFRRLLINMLKIYANNYMAHSKERQYLCINKKIRDIM